MRIEFFIAKSIIFCVNTYKEHLHASLGAIVYNKDTQDDQSLNDRT